LMQHAGIDPKDANELVITGMGEKMEVWSAGRYAERVLADDLDFAQLAEEVRKDLEGFSGKGS